MAEVVAKQRFGPATFTAGAAITGGSLVKAGSGGTAGMVIPVNGATDQWIGVALYDAQPATATGEDTVWGNPRIDTSVPRSNVAVAWTGVFKLVAGEALNFGDVVYPSTAGGVQKTTATGRAVGQVIEPGGIANGARGAVRLF